MSTAALRPVSWQRMEQGINDVKRRLERAAAALTKSDVSYAVVSGNAVAAWVSRVDAAAVRNTRDVDILLNRDDMDRARSALEGAGFVHRRVASLGKAASMDVFLDGPEAKVRDAVHVLWAGEKAMPDAIEATPELRRLITAGDQVVAKTSDVGPGMRAWAREQIQSHHDTSFTRRTNCYELTPPSTLARNHARSKRSRLITLVHAATKSFTNFFSPSAQP